jgi:hypothetical protein
MHCWRPTVRSKERQWTGRSQLYLLTEWPWARLLKRLQATSSSSVKNHHEVVCLAQWAQCMWQCLNTLDPPPAARLRQNPNLHTALCHHWVSISLQLVY